MTKIPAIRELVQVIHDDAVRAMDLCPDADSELLSELEALCTGARLIIEMCDEREPPSDDEA